LHLKSSVGLLWMLRNISALYMSLEKHCKHEEWVVTFEKVEDELYLSTVFETERGEHVYMLSKREDTIMPVFSAHLVSISSNSSEISYNPHIPLPVLASVPPRKHLSSSRTLFGKGTKQEKIDIIMCYVATRQDAT
jgi:hypothetical protein